MKKILIFFILLIILLVPVFLYISRINKEITIMVSNSTEIRIGWQIPWATQGQLAQVLKNTDILKKYGLHGNFKGFSSGAPLNEAALAGDIDVLFTADQPAATLLAKNPNWVIIGRLMYNRVSLYVPPLSPINSVADLKGKTVAMPFGAAAQRMALKAEKDAGLDLKKDVNNINLDIYEQSDLVRDLNSVKWGSIDAMAGFDPTPAIFEEKGLIKVLQTGKVVSLIVMSNKFIEKNPNAPVQFLKAFYDAYDYYRNNITKADNWFKNEAKLDITPKALEISASIEPNLKIKSKSDIKINLTNEDLTIMQEAADFIFDQGLVKNRVEMKNFVDLSYLEKALK